MPIRDTLRAAVLRAVRERDRDAADACRAALSAIDNAEAVDVVDDAAPSTVGPGSGDVPRRELGEEQMIALVRAEADEARASAVELAAHPDVAARLRRRGDLLDAVLLLDEQWPGRA